MAEKLEKYNKKRDFDKTNEPQGKALSKEGKNEKKLRFVVQHHLARRDHYDLRLEWEGTLLSWAVPKGPSYNPKDKRLAIRVEDHPLDYRHFEGTIPKGEYGGGTVMLWDEGYWEPHYDAGEGLEKGSLKFTLYGKRLEGNWALARLQGKEEDDKENWLLIKEKDEFSKTTDGIQSFTTGIRSGLTMEEIEQGSNGKKIKNPFTQTEAQAALLVSGPPKGEGWIFEPKYDGYRILAYIEGGLVRLITRNGNDFTNYFPSIKTSLADFSGNRAAVLDGEVVIADKSGRTDFQALQNHIKNKKGEKPTYAVFDILSLDGEDLRALPLSERKEILKKFMEGARGNLYLSKTLKGDGNENFLSACELGLEGLIAKKIDSVYSGKRNGDWVKIKCGKRQEFVVGGYILTEKKTEGLSALLLGYYEGNKLIFAGRAGTGFTEKSRKELANKFKPLITEKIPFSALPKIKNNETVFWLKPKTVAEIQFAGWTDANSLRQPSFKGLRADKDPFTVTRETETTVEDIKERDTEIMETKNISQTIKEKRTNGSPVIGGVKVTSPDKIIFTRPKVIKGDIVSYYEKVAEYMYKYAGERILSIIRCPKGVSGSCFYKKHPGSPGKGITVMPVKGGSGENDYFYISDPVGFISEAQMGTLEFHTWGSRADNLDKPDVMVFDLDPDEGMDLESVKQGVRDIKDILDELSLQSFLKVSGGKGYHIVVPFETTVGWDTFGSFAKQIAGVMEKKFPDRYTTNMRKEKRKGKIFIDWVRNGRGATSVAPYSLRAREGARVAAPIFWEELDTINPDGIDMVSALSRLNQPDPWEGFYNAKQKIKL